MGYILPQAKFLRYQNIFYSKVANSPYFITLRVYSVVTDPGSIEEFVGDSDRPYKDYVFPCLYEKEDVQAGREKFGNEEKINGVIYLSPLQLVPLVGTFLIDRFKMKILFEGKMQVINKVTYLESLFGSCVSVQIGIVDDVHGG